MKWGERLQRDAARRLRTHYPVHRTRQRLGHLAGQRGLPDTGLFDHDDAPLLRLPDQSGTNRRALCLTPKHRPRSRHGSLARVAAWFVGGLIVFITGFDRVALGVHYVTDVLAGCSTGRSRLTTDGER